MEASAPAVSAAGLSGAMLRAFALIALAGAVIGRALAPALPGSRAGIGLWIAIFDRSAAVLAQLTCVFGFLIVTRLLLSGLRERKLGITYRLLALPLAAASATLVLASGREALPPHFTLGVAASSAIVALASAAHALSSARTRAVGLVLGLAGTAALVFAVARLMSINASERALASLFDTSRSIATFGFVLDIATMAIAALWLASRRWLRLAVTLSVLLTIAALFAWNAARSTTYDQALWQVLLARTLDELVRHPAPLVPLFVRHAVEVLALMTAGALLLARPRALPLQTALALTLMSRASTDIPLFALLLLVAALLAALASLDATESNENSEAVEARASTSGTTADSRRDT